jgi:hypothetical protein
MRFASSPALKARSANGRRRKQCSVAPNSRHNGGELSLLSFE